MSDFSIPDRLRNAIAKYGIIGISKLIVNKITKFIFYSTSSIWFKRNLSDPITQFIPDIDLKIEYLVHDKCRLIYWLRENMAKFPWIYFEKEIEAALTNKHVYLIMTNRDKIIGYVKIGVGQTYINDFDQTIEFKTGTAFVYDTFTLPEFRGKSLALYALSQACVYFKSLDYQQIMCHIERWNIPSIKTFEKAGFRPVDSIKFVRISCLSFFVRRGFIPFRNLEKHLCRLTSNGQV